jgi:hypothetical protein
VFQHFDDLESLYATVSDAQMARMSHFISQETGAGPFAERTRSFVDRRAELLETITPVRRAALLQEPFSEELARRLRWAHDMAREELGERLRRNSRASARRCNESRGRSGRRDELVGLGCLRQGTAYRSRKASV